MHILLKISGHICAQLRGFLFPSETGTQEAELILGTRSKVCPGNAFPPRPLRLDNFLLKFWGTLLSAKVKRYQAGNFSLLLLLV